MATRRPLTPAETDAAYTAAQVVVETHRRLSGFLRHGQTLAEIDKFVAAQLAEQGAASCFYGYKTGRKPAFMSHACLSVNECVVHGTATYRAEPLKRGDVLKVDIGARKNGWIGDAAWTYVFGEPTPTVAKLTRAGKESLEAGVKELRPGNTYRAWARVVQRIVERDYGFHLIQGMGGHGLLDAGGRPALHGPPYISNRLPEAGSDWADADTPCRPGDLVAVEPMIAVGTGELAGPSDRERKRAGVSPLEKWPEIVADGSLSVHYEHDVLITERGPRVLTEGLERTPDIVTR
ncbi:MAG TPA: methionyl aminopeptidase [Phycisphaerales bacterium]|nr:methionyl aminopeptidase [Phycisphaerales bacterium]